MNVFSLSGIDPQTRTAWRSCIRSISRLLPTQATGTPAADDKIKSGSSQVKSSQRPNDKFSVILGKIDYCNGNALWQAIYVSVKYEISMSIGLGN